MRFGCGHPAALVDNPRKVSARTSYSSDIQSSDVRCNSMYKAREHHQKGGPTSRMHAREVPYDVKHRVAGPYIIFLVVQHGVPKRVTVVLLSLSSQHKSSRTRRFRAELVGKALSSA